MLCFVFYSRIKANQFLFYPWLFALKVLAFLVVPKNIKDPECTSPNIDEYIPLHIELPRVDAWI